MCRCEIAGRGSSRAADAFPSRRGCVGWAGQRDVSGLEALRWERMRGQEFNLSKCGIARGNREFEIWGEISVDHPLPIIWASC